MPLDWQAGFLKQARADFEIVELFQREQVPIAACHLLHYLQMTLEKLSKGMMATPGLSKTPVRSHKGAARFLQVMAKGTSPVARDFRARLGLGNAQRRALIIGLLPTVEALEQLAPALAGEGPNLEYPWLLPHATDVSIPVDHDFLTGALSQQKSHQAHRGASSTTWRGFVKPEVEPMALTRPPLTVTRVTSFDCHLPP